METITTCVAIMSAVCAIVSLVLGFDGTLTMRRSVADGWFNACWLAFEIFGCVCLGSIILKVIVRTSS